MARPVRVQIYKRPSNLIDPPKGVTGYGPSTPYTTEDDWVNPDAVVDLREPHTTPPANARRHRYVPPGGGRERLSTQNQGSVACTAIHLVSYGNAGAYGGGFYPRNGPFVVGSVVDVIDLLWPPTVAEATGISIVVSKGELEIAGTREGSQTRFIQGEIAHLDAKLLRGAYWRIVPLASGTVATFKVTDNPNFTAQVEGSGGTWTDVTNNLAITARGFYRVKPAATE